MHGSPENFGVNIARVKAEVHMNMFRRMVVEAGAGTASAVAGIVGWIYVILGIAVFSTVYSIQLGNSMRLYGQIFILILTVTTFWQAAYAGLIRAAAYRFNLSAVLGFMIGYVICVLGNFVVVALWLRGAVNSAAEGANLAIIAVPMTAIAFLTPALAVFPVVLL